MHTTCPHCPAINPFPPETSGTEVLCPQCHRTYFAEPNPEDETEGYRSCPFCHEKIRAGAKKCRWCHEFLEEKASPDDAVTAGQGSQEAKAPSLPLKKSVPLAKANDAEEELLRMHPSWKGLVAPLALCLVVLCGCIPFLPRMEWSLYVVLGILFVFLLWFVKLFFAIFTTHYVLSDQRLLVSDGLLTRQEVEVRISDIRAVWLKQNLWEQLLNYGDVLIGTSATAGAEISIADIDAPREVLELLHQLIQS